MYSQNKVFSRKQYVEISGMFKEVDMEKKKKKRTSILTMTHHPQ